MATITLEYNARSVQAQKALENILSMGFFKSVAISKSMQRALDDEREGRVTKIVNPKNAVAEILG